MTLPVKITLLLATIIILFICIHSAFLYTQINKNFRQQAEIHMEFCSTLIQKRVDFLKQNLTAEMTQLSASLYTENETVLAAMLSNPPEFNTDVIHFAETLRRRTTLHFLSVMTEDGTVLTSSEHPAAFGRADSFRDFPLDQPAGLQEDGSPRYALQRQATFGGRTLLLRGGYLLRKEFEGLTIPGVQIRIWTPDSSAGTPPTGEFSRSIALRDYRNLPFLLITADFSPHELLEQRKDVIRRSLILIFASIVLCLVLGHILSRWISRPLAQLTDAAMLMSVGGLDVRIPEGAGGEVGELMQAFNLMASRLEEKQRQLAQTERVAAWQEIARHLAHEIKNPLTPIRTSIANLRLSLEKAPEKFPEIFLEATSSVLEEVEKLRRLADEFARFARLPAPELRVSNLNDLIQQCLALYREQPGIEIAFAPGDIPEFAFDKTQIGEVIHNLLRNAIEAMPRGGRIDLSTRASAEHKNEIIFELRDSGPGMDEETRRQIFVPYFTTKEKGTGLGLAIVQRIIVEHRGTITAESSPGHGTRFVVRFEI